MEQRKFFNFQKYSAQKQIDMHVDVFRANNTMPQNWFENNRLAIAAKIVKNE
jgi:hypothetical protein